MWLSPQWQTGLISAITAAVVTVGVEYAIRPGLEARKDRAIALSKAIQGLHANLMDLLIDAEYLTSRQKNMSALTFGARLRQCEQGARAIAMQHRHWRHIRRVLHELQLSRRRLDPLQGTPPKNTRMYQEFQDGLAHFYAAASRFLYRRREITRMISMLRIDLKDLLSYTDTTWRKGNYVDPEVALIDTYRCVHQARIIATRRSKRHNIHDVLITLESVRQKLQLSLRTSGSTSADSFDPKTLDETFSNLYKFMFTHRPDMQKWIREQIRKPPDNFAIG